MPALPYQLVWLYPSLWHHVMLHAGVWVGWTCQALGLYLTFLLTLAQPGDFQALALVFPGRCSRAQYTLKMRKRLLGRSTLGVRAGRLEGFRLLKGGLQCLWVHQDWGQVSMACLKDTGAGAQSFLSPDVHICNVVPPLNPWRAGPPRLLPLWHCHALVCRNLKASRLAGHCG